MKGLTVDEVNRLEAKCAKTAYFPRFETNTKGITRITLRKRGNRLPERNGQPPLPVPPGSDEGLDKA